MDEMKLDYEGMYRQLSKENKGSKEIRNAVILCSTALEFAITQIVAIGAKKLNIPSFQKLLKKTFVPISIKLKLLRSENFINETLCKNLLILFQIRNKFAHELFIVSSDTAPAFVLLKDAKIDDIFLKNLPSDSIKFQLLVSKCFGELVSISKKLDPNSVLELELVGDFEKIED
jgi:hypothetical protein